MNTPLLKCISLSAIGYGVSALAARAHPGHGPDEIGPSRYLTSSDHLGLALLVAVVAFCLLNSLCWRKNGRSGETRIHFPSTRSCAGGDLN